MRRWIAALLLGLAPMLMGAEGCESPKDRTGVVTDRNNPPCVRTNPGAGEDSPCAPRDWRIDTNNSDGSFSVTQTTWQRCSVGEAYPECSYTENRNKYVNPK